MSGLVIVLEFIAVVFLLLGVSVYVGALITGIWEKYGN